MRTLLIAFTCIILLTLHSCQKDNRSKAEAELETTGENGANASQDTPVKLLEYLVGEWQRESGDDAAGPGQPGERLTFTSEARYLVHEGNQSIDSGAFRMNEQLRSLYLESEINQTTREYEVVLREDIMTLKPKQGGGQYVYRRVAGGATQPADRVDDLP